MRVEPHEWDQYPYKKIHDSLLSSLPSPIHVRIQEEKAGNEQGVSADTRSASALILNLPALLASPSAWPRL